MKVTDFTKKGEFVKIVELLPPKELNLDKLEQRVSLIQDHADFISLTSKKEAYAVTSLDAASSLSLRGAVRAEFIAHITLIEFGEIRELPFIRLMGAHRFGVGNLLVMRGDGEFAGGSYCYACDLVKAICDMNRGTDPSGNRCEPTDFCIGAVISQYRDREEEFKAARAKRINGAEYFITQMCFDPYCEGRHEEYSYPAFCERLFDFLGERVPVIAGVPIPDRSTIRFIEEKGATDPIYIPDAVRRRILESKDDKEERITIAREVLSYFRDDIGVPGVDVFSTGNVKLASRILEES
jgi:5,10-methylenetetrahydrofolate reductase